jgi:ethanolamine utilization microcompartment shell protein EutS
MYHIFFFFLCSKALIAEEKLIHVETPGSYQQVALSEFCITPSEDQTLKFDVKARSNAIALLFTDSGTSGFFYDIVIGGNGNRVAILRRRSPGKLKNKQYVFVGLYKTRISVLFPEIRLYFSVIVFILLYSNNFRFKNLFSPRYICT